MLDKLLERVRIDGDVQRWVEREREVEGGTGLGGGGGQVEREGRGEGGGEVDGEQRVDQVLEVAEVGGWME